MTGRFIRHLLAQLCAGTVLALAPQTVSADVVLTDDFTGNSGGVPEGWFRFMGYGGVVEQGTTVTLGLGPVMLGSLATVDPNSGILTMVTDFTRIDGQGASGVVSDLAFPVPAFFGAIRLSDGRVEVNAWDANGQGQYYDVGFLVGYTGGPIQLTVVLGPTTFSVSTDSPAFSTGPIAYTTAFPTFTREDLGNENAVMFFNYGDAGVTIVDKVLVYVGTTTGVEESPRPMETALAPNYPNPFASRTTIRFSLVEPGPAQLRVFDVQGRLVRTLVDGERPTGIHEVTWQADDDRGVRAAAGVYFYVLTTSDLTLKEEMVVLR